MHAVVINSVMLALFNLGGGELILIIVLVLILFGARHGPDLARGLGTGLRMFRKALGVLDEEASVAGRSVGGLYGRPAAQAITPDNQVAELYKPSALESKKSERQGTWVWRAGFKKLVRLFLWLIIRRS
jgi:sec-independent protein translocase protein TatA